MYLGGMFTLIKSFVDDFFGDDKCYQHDPTQKNGLVRRRE